MTSAPQEPENKGEGRGRGGGHAREEERAELAGDGAGDVAGVGRVHAMEAAAARARRKGEEHTLAADFAKLWREMVAGGDVGEGECSRSSSGREKEELLRRPGI
nr:unnamed protein product [Digitaria exilis]